MRRIPDDKKRHILTLHDRRLPQAEIAKIVGCSVGLVNKVLKAARAEAPPPPPQDPAEDVPEAIPEGTDMGTVDKWLTRLDDAAEAARQRSDFQAVSTLMAKYVALLEHKRKAAPPPPIDPNENPDLIAAAERVRERWHKLIDGLAGK